MRTIDQATRTYEDWLQHQTTIITSDLSTKHSLMAQGPFPFLRATFYRWLQVWPDVCEALRSAPPVLAVGDLHVENFGTWRDAEGRLVWGVNDFDEACYLPYTNDLVRLATSALFAVDLSHLGLKERTTCDAILEGYTDGLAQGGKVFLLAEEHGWLRRIATEQLRDPHAFWKRMMRWPLVPTKQVPKEARAAFEAAMPEPKLECKILRRSAGLGSRGHQRYVAIAEWRGGKIAREAKAMTPSAALWLTGKGHKLLYTEIVSRSVRSADPCLKLHGDWIVRRLAPDSTKIDITELPSGKDEEAILYCMGWETANIHLGSEPAVARIRKDLQKRKGDWLLDSARAMVRAIRRDWKDWRE